MIKGACHCGAVRFELPETPAWLTRCNCSYCARSGALWGHDEIGRITLEYGPEDVVRYIWGDKTLAFVSVDGLYRAMGYDGRDQVNPQFTDHCFTGDYPTPLTDRHGKSAPRQLSLLAETG